ncbi:MAG: hypothetical protein C9356_03920 [Oleiphilus sp.]|nr:MAG: hypothetical protein C9356_03920 [Oleiphilus sp.]
MGRTHPDFTLPCSQWKVLMKQIFDDLNTSIPVTNADGKERRIGVEIELAGLTAEQMANLVKAEFGGDIVCNTIFDYTVSDTCFGDFTIELDADYLKEIAEVLGLHAESSSEGDMMELLEKTSKDALTKAAEALVPWEIVSPPIALSELPRFDTLTPMLRKSGAIGTRGSIRYAFGMHLNPELPSLDAGVITAHLKAYFCLFDWIKEQEQVDFARRVTPYIDHFGSDYIDLVLDPHYRPDLDQLVSDYLSHNPTRNRSLDMLPLFCHLRPEMVKDAIEDDRVKSRPTFHYRLPNCDIDNPEWRVATSWDRWCLVERLAGSADLQKVCDAYLEERSRLLSDLTGQWAKRIGSMIGQAA